MASPKPDIAAQCAKLVKEAENGVFYPIYLLMGDEPYYPELVCQAVIDNCVDEFSKDFNETICFGSDVTTEQVITAARRYPMMAERQLVVVKEAQLMKGIEDLAVYLAEPLESTVLVILMHKASADKRKALYKAAQKVGVVVDSPSLRDWEMPKWIESYFHKKGLQIEPQAAMLMVESTGTEMQAIAMETDKLLKNLPVGATKVSVADIEKNVGVSRQFSIFELTKAISTRNSTKALKLASHIANSAKFSMPMAVNALYTEFSRILKYNALLASGKQITPELKARALPGVNPYFYRDYDAAVRNYPLPKAMAVMSLLCEFDYLGKGGDGGASTPDQLLVELVARILS